MRMNCALSSSDSYIQHAGVCIYSVFDNNRDIEQIHVYLLDNHISDKNKQRLNKVAETFSGDGERKIIYIDLYKISSKLHVSTDFSLSTYGKLFLGQIAQVDRILYLDSDTVCVGSLKQLLTMDLEDASVWGVQDTVNHYFVEAIGLTRSDRYINCGVVVIDLKQWRELDMEAKFVDYIESYNGNPPYVDQGVLNRICKTGILPPAYNVINPMFMYSVKRIKKLFRMDTYYTQEEIDAAKEHPVVIHFTGELYHRPWCSDCTHPLKQYYLKYMKKLPGGGEMMDKPFSKNVRIQNMIYYHGPFWVYVWMIRFIELRHRLMKRSMRDG